MNKKKKRKERKEIFHETPVTSATTRQRPATLFASFTWKRSKLHFPSLVTVFEQNMIKVDTFLGRRERKLLISFEEIPFYEERESLSPSRPQYRGRRNNGDSNSALLRARV